VGIRYTYGFLLGATEKFEKGHWFPVTLPIFQKMIYATLKGTGK